ncbi:MAG: SgcJ/EcaC family oxidoreductase [Gemmatimonadota bacterium]|nr:MAG: SgcJ/EcaC family oxidoreductase [Gemmatimonadota bacterium]
MSARTALLAVLALALASVACQPPAQETAGLSEEDVVAIQDLFQRFDDTTNTGDAENWMTLLADDVLWMVPNQEMLVSKEAVRTRVQPFFDQLDMEHTTTLEKIEVAGQWAFVRGTYTFRTTPKAGGETSEDIGKFIYILGRQSDGSWKIDRGIWNSDLPLAEEGAEART